MRLKGFRFLVLTLLCLLAMAMPPAIAQLRQQPTGVQLVDQAQQHYQSGRYQAAIPLLQQAVEQFSAQQDGLNQAMALSNLAAIYGQLNEWTQANQTIQASLSLLNAQPKTGQQQQLLAQSLDMQGQLQFEQGKPQDALDSWTAAVDRYHTLNAHDRWVTSQINQSRALQALGLYPRACNTLLVALQLADPSCIAPETIERLKQQPTSLQITQGIIALGHVLRVLGQLDSSQQILSLAIQQAQQLKAPQEVAVASLNLGNTLRAIASQPSLDPTQRQQLERATLDAYQQAEQRATNPITRLQAQLNRLSLLVDGQRLSEAEALGRSLNDRLNQFPSGRAGLFARINLAQSWMKLASLPASKATKIAFLNNIQPLLRQANLQAIQLGDRRLQAYALNSLAKLAELQSQWANAEQLTTQALSLAPPFQSPDIAYQLFWQLGRIHKAQGDMRTAVAHYSQAVDLLTSLRGDLVTINPDVQFSFRDSVEPIYRELISLLLSENLSEQQHLRQARQVLESLQLAELDNFFRDACADAKPQLIDEVDRTAAVIYPIILSDRLEIILAIPNQPLRHYTVHKSQTELEQFVKQVRVSLRRAAFPQDYLPLAQQLYGWLISPAEAVLQEGDIQTLVFVLDGSLRNVPMSILHDGQQYLIQKYSIAVTPGLQLLSPKPLQSGSLKALAGGMSEASQGFEPLPAVAQEVTQINNNLPAKVLLNQDFTRSNIQKQINAKPFPIVHLATHGQFSSSADQTFLLTWDGRITVRQLDTLLKSREIAAQQLTPKQRQAIELLILSACETATGDQRAALGMAGIAIRSGARSTLATLWLVNDDATADLMTEFYRQFTQPGRTRADALRQAQLKLLSQPQTQHPYYWAAFVMIGNWL